MIRRIIVFGDSISFGSNDRAYGGWVVRLKNYFARTGQFHHVFNLGISGENSSQILKRVEIEIGPRISTDPEKKSLLLVCIPINDTRISGSVAGSSEIGKDEFAGNLANLYSLGKKNVDEIVFVGMTNVDEKKTNPWQEVIERRIACWRNDVIEEYNEIAKNYCKQNGIRFIDMFGLFDESDLSDGLHPNEIGHEKMYEKIKSFLIEKNMIKNIDKSSS